MSEDGRPSWLRLAQELQAIAQAGLTYARDPYDLERYQQLRDLAVGLAARELPASPEEVKVAFASGHGYPTPKVDVRAVVFRGEEILLVREARTGRWTFPGGWADIGDTPAAAAVRETLEESGYLVVAEKVLGLLDKTRRGHPPSVDYTYKVLIGCRLEGGEPRTSHEIDGISFFSERSVPELDLDRTTPQLVDLAFAHHRDPSRPTDFD